MTVYVLSILMVLSNGDLDNKIGAFASESECMDTAKIAQDKLMGDLKYKQIKVQCVKATVLK